MLVQALQAGTAVVVALCYGVGYDSMGLLAADYASDHAGIWRIGGCTA
ncbi:permease of the major facilitator superfamily [Vibrio cholerae]|nr:permease of the major facilitator superfamily [Vibrio cholerae]